MSFFRNIRSTITRGKSSSCDDSPATRNSTATSSITTIRRDSIDSRTDSLLNRSDTFILNSDTEDKSSPSSNSTLEKKSKKSKVLSKFSTFTKRKKTPTPEPTAAAAAAVANALEHHPSENATNTYYKWRSDGPMTLDYYDSQTDPFNFLYEQHSSIKSMQNGGAAGSGTASTYTIQSGNSNNAFDSSTYRKGKMPTQLREQLSQLKTHTKADLHETEEMQAAPQHHENEQTEAEKYKTVTLNSFRRSFREKFMQNEQKAPHNPAWFVEVEPPKTAHADTRERGLESKENRPDILVFDNEDYRPSSRSPVRDRKERTSQSSKRSPVKRNETFRLERPTLGSSSPTNSAAQRTTAASDGSSIRIEIKNSISPHMPSRMVPVGVAKPILSPYMQEYYNNPNAKVTTTTSTKQSNFGREKSPLRNWGKPITVTPVHYASPARPSEKGRYQTLVQIRNESNAKPTSVSTTAPLNRSRLSTRIQLGTGSPTLQKRLNTAGTRYSLATPTQHSPFSHSEPLKQLVGVNTNRVQLRSSDALSQGRNTKHTYFGGEVQRARSLMPSNGTASAMGRQLGSGGCVGVQPSKLQQPQSRFSAGVGSGQLSRVEPQQQQQQQRIVVSTQRRSRSPIKMPWR